jgi:hypothetical protein
MARTQCLGCRKWSTRMHVHGYCPDCFGKRPAGPADDYKVMRLELRVETAPAPYTLDVSFQTMEAPKTREEAEAFLLACRDRLMDLDDEVGVKTAVEAGVAGIQKRMAALERVAEAARVLIKTADVGYGGVKAAVDAHAARDRLAAALSALDGEGE